MKKHTVALLACVLCFILSSCFSTPGASEDLPLRIIFLDVGQGDAVLIQTPKGNILIDAGPDDAEATLCRKLRDYGVRELALAVFTHPDEDHIGGADGVLEAFPTKEIWLSVATNDGEAFALLTRAAERQGSVIRQVVRGEHYVLGETALQVLSPTYGMKADSNAGSIVIKLTCGKASALFVGDADAKVEEELVYRFGSAYLSVDLYKVGHHGSFTSTSQIFLNAMQPEWAVISCSAENPFGHPHGEVLERLENAGVSVERTDLSGDIVFVCDGERFYHETK